jgi:hypothetical protein
VRLATCAVEAPFGALAGFFDEIKSRAQRTISGVIRQGLESPAAVERMADRAASEKLDEVVSLLKCCELESVIHQILSQISIEDWNRLRLKERASPSATASALRELERRGRSDLCAAPATAQIRHRHIKAWHRLWPHLATCRLLTAELLDRGKNVVQRIGTGTGNTRLVYLRTRLVQWLGDPWSPRAPVN